jgi:DNA-binding XRE family transcriptional regulator
MRRRKTIADWTAGVLALIVLGLGGLVVVKPAVDHWDDLYRSHPFEVGTATERVVKESGGKPSERTITRKQASASLPERVLGNSGLLLLRLSLVALTAFLAAAVLHRALLGSYGLRGSPLAPRAPARASKRAVERALASSDDSAETAVADGNGLNEQEAGGGTLAPAIAKLVASRREELGLSQRELAKRAGISHTVISRIENGQHAPSAKTLGRLADALRKRS